MERNRFIAGSGGVTRRQIHGAAIPICLGTTRTNLRAVTLANRVFARQLRRDHRRVVARGVRNALPDAPGHNERGLSLQLEVFVDPLEFGKGVKEPVRV